MAGRCVVRVCGWRCVVRVCGWKVCCEGVWLEGVL